LQRQIADRFEADVKGVVGAIAKATQDMRRVADEITTSVNGASERTAAAAAASEEASASVATVAAGTEEVSHNVAGASHAADQSRALADNVLGASGELGQHAAALFKSVDAFLAGLRDAA
jgi:methyl-accepting chemotaxis protein